MSTKRAKRKRSNGPDTCSNAAAPPPTKRRKTSSLAPDRHNKENQDVSNHIHSDPMHKTRTNSDDILHFKYESDFDENGFIFYLGTNGKTCDTFHNPAIRGLISITGSPLMADSASRNQLVGRTAERLISEAIQNAAFVLDFTNTKCEISPTHYTLRHYKSWDTEGLRNWQFCGSHDGIQWTVIKHHNQDTSLKKRGQSHTWRIPHCTAYYSWFRIYRFRANNNGNHLACSGFEIYGNVRSQSAFSSNDDADSDIEIMANSPKKKPSHHTALKVKSKTQAVDKPLPQALTDSLSIETSSNCNSSDASSTTDILLSMGYDAYMVSECMKYMNGGDMLSNAMDWLSAHDITECERKNNKIIHLCTIIECARYKALHALKQSDDNNTQRALDLLMNDNAEPLSSQQMDDLQMEDFILTTALNAVHESRKKEQQFKKIRPLMISELRSMGFLHIAVHKAVHDPSVFDKKSAIQYILSHPLDRAQESSAKTQEIMNSGYSNHDAITALNRYSQNLEMAMLWLMQGKPAKIRHFIYHVESKRVVEISRNHSNHASNVALSDRIHFKNANQHWTLYADGKIKNFANNEVLTVCKEESSDGTEYKLSVRHEAKECDDDAIWSVWEMDESEKTIQNKECGLFLVYRSDSKQKQFTLERKIHCGDLSQRWCFVDYNELIKLNPKELAKSLDSQEFECVICWENEPNLRLEPCGHSSFCEKCINELMPSECPICRTKIHSKRQCKSVLCDV